MHRIILRLLMIISVVFALTSSLLIATPVSAITNGVPDGSGHPYVVLIVFDDAPGHPAWRASGVVLSPTVVLTAGHATDGAVAARVWIDTTVEGNSEYPYSGATSYDGVPYTNPEFSFAYGNGLPGADTHDVGIVVLSEPIPTSALSDYGQLPTVGLVDTLPPMSAVDLVGYGVQYQLRGGGPPIWSGERTRYYAPAKIVDGKNVLGDEFIMVTANPGQGKGGTTFGDSGSPILLAGTRTILAVDSFGLNSNCAGVGYSNRVDIADILTWVNTFLP